jgi:predicted metal-dependent peptidase
MTTQEKVAKGRAQLVLDQVFFGSLALRLNVVEDPGCGTMWVDGTTLGYEPAYVEKCSMDELKGLICHEVLHCAFLHHTRHQGRDPEVWNEAGDFAINPVVLDAGMKLPGKPLYSREFAGKSADEIYNTLMKQKQNQQKSGNQGQGQNGQDQSGSSGQNGDKPGNQKSSQPGEVRQAKAKDGSGREASEAEVREQAEEWKIALSQSAQAAERAGQLPGSMKRIIADILEPKLDWTELLKRFVDSSARNDYSWSRPSRRHIASGQYFPSIYSHRLGSVVAGVDTSGSISQSDLTEYMSELQFIVGEYGAECEVIQADYSVQHVDHFDAGDDLEVELFGGGGTRFSPVFDYIGEAGLNPTCMVYFTDGWCDEYPEYTPDYPVLWVVTRRDGFEPPFGEVIKL